MSLRSSEQPPRWVEVPFYPRAPSTERVRALLAARRDAPFTYDAVGLTREGPPRAPDGFVLDAYGAELGRGSEVWERAKGALRAFGHYPPSFTRIVRLDPELREGALFATVAEHYGFASAHPCRIIYVIDEATRFGFGFGTLPGHSERGEERFVVAIDGDGWVSYDVRAFSRPTGVITRLGAPIARSLQRRFQRETVAEMRRRCR